MIDNESKRILIVEDDLKLANLIKEFLEPNSFDVLLESRGDRAIDRILNEDPDLVILDLMLPGMDGLSICRQVRNRFGKPILMLTARGEEVDEIVGLEVGADDYLAKPVRPRLLLARINTLLRRHNTPMNPVEEEKTDDSSAKLLQLGSLEIDVPNRIVRVDGREKELTTSEFDLLLFLAKHPGKVLDREDIYKEVRGIEWDGIDRSIDLRIARLRKKLGDDAKIPQRIKSIRGVGYLLTVK